MASVTHVFGFSSQRFVLNCGAHAILWPLRGTQIKIFHAKTPIVLDRHFVAVLPESIAPPEVETESTVIELLAVRFNPKIVALAQARYDLPHRVDQRAWSKPSLVPASLWISELFHRLFFEVSTCGGVANEVSRFVSTELFKEICHAAGDPNRKYCANRVDGDFWPSSLIPTIDYMERHLDQPLNLPKLAKAAAMSESALRRIFTKELGTTPMTFLRRLRMEMAQRLLSEGRASVGEVLGIVGYSDPSGFSRAYREHFGRTPRDSR